MNCFLINNPQNHQIIDKFKNCFEIVRRSVSPVGTRNPGALTIGGNAESSNSANNFYGIRQQRNDKMESVKQELYS